MKDVEREIRGSIGRAEDFAERGKLIQKVDEDYLPQGDLLVVASTPKAKFKDNGELAIHVETFKVVFKEGVPSQTEEEVKILPDEFVELVGYLDIGEYFFASLIGLLSLIYYPVPQRLWFNA